jgi:hypothetical protein
MPFLPDSIAKIYKSSDLINPVWSGVTNSYGMVVDINGNKPYLSYGDYTVTIEKCDYDTETKSFNIPNESAFSMSVGCSSSITVHETMYDHSRLATMSADLLANKIPVINGFNQNPSPLIELTDNNWNDYTVPGIVQSLAGGIKIGTITYDLESLKYVTVIIADLKFRLNGWNYSTIGTEVASIRVNVFNGTQWVRMYENTKTESNAQVSFDSGLLSMSIPIYYYDNATHIQVELYVDSCCAPTTIENSTATLYGRRIRAIG